MAIELKDIEKFDNEMTITREDTLKLTLGLMFVIAVMLLVSLQQGSNATVLIIAAMVGAYMAMNIGANDVANNVGPAVGSGAVTLMGAIIIAAIFEAAGALIAGGDVVSTIKKGIIDPSTIKDTDTFIWLMLAALFAAALWLNAATALGAPVSTTHSIVGGVMGAGIAAAGWAVVNWGTMGKIAASWVISPVLGGLIAAGFLYYIKQKIIYTDNILENAKKHVPVLIGIMAMAFATYLSLKGVKHIIKLSFPIALSIGAVFGVAAFVFMKNYLAKKALSLQNDRDSLNDMFTIPLIFAAALLSFAHGANDVANAVGPLAAINDAFSSGNISSKVGIPLWVMAIGAFGIAVGLALYGPKLIKTVGSEITELDKVRAFSIAMAAAITVIVASQLKLPVSSTHIAVGGVFGVGLLREWLNRRNFDDSHIDHLAKLKEEHEEIEDFINRFNKAPLKEKEDMLKTVKDKKSDIVVESNLSKAERKMIAQLFRQKLVKRSALSKIIAAWLITVPASAFLAALLFYTIKGYMAP